MDKTMRVFIPQLATFGVEETFNNRINKNYIAQHWATTGFKQKQKPVGHGYKRGKFGVISKPTGNLGEDLPPLPLHPIHNLLNSQVASGGQYQLLMNPRNNKRSMMLYNQHLQGGDDLFQLPFFGNEKGTGNVYQPSSLTTGSAYNKWMKRNSGGTTADGSKGAQNFHLTGQTPQALAGHDTSHGYPYAVGNFPTPKPGGYGSQRLQNALNSNRNRYFQYQLANELPESTSNRMLQGIQGGHFNSMEPHPQYGVNRFYMNGNNGNRRMPHPFLPSFNQVGHGTTHASSSQSFDSMLPNIPGQSEFDDADEEEGNFRYRYNSKSTRNSAEYNTNDLIGKYAKYYRTQDFHGESKKQLKGVTSSNNKNSELVSRYLKHAAKKQVRSTSISVPKYTGDYDPEVFITGNVQSKENMSESSLTKISTSQEEITKESLLNKQEAAAEQKFRLEKSNFPAPTSLSKASAAENKSDKAQYKLRYTKRKKMVIASTSDKENDPSMLVKGGDDVALGNDDEVSEQTQEKKVEVDEQKPIIEEKTEVVPTKVPPVKKIIKKMRRPSVVPKLVPEKVVEKKVEPSNKQQPEQTNKPKVVRSVDIKKQVKKVTIEKVKRTIPIVARKNEEQNKEEDKEMEDKLQPIVEEEELLPLKDDSYHSNMSEDEFQLANDEDNAEKLEQEKAEDELNAILAPLRAQVPDHLRISPTLGFLPIMPVTFSWFPMSQQHKEAFKKMSEQSKFPNSLRPFKRFAAT